MASYKPKASMLKATKGGSRLQKDPMRPKKPRSAYLYFGEATRAELSGDGSYYTINGSKVRVRVKV